MKKAMKRLMSLLLVAVLLVSAVPFQASANSGITIDFTIKDTDETILVQQTINDTAGAYTLGQYFNVRGDATKYTPIKYWIKNADTGNDGLTVDANHTVTRDSKVVIKVQRNPVTLNMDIYFDGKYTRTVTKSASIGSTITLNDALATEAGYGSYNTDVRTTTLAEGQSFTVGESNNPNIQIFVVSGNNNSGSDGSGDSNSTTKQPITLNIKNVEGGSVVWSTSKEPSGDTAVVSDMLKYWYNSSWANSYNCTKVYSSAQGSISLSTAVSAGDTVTVVLEAKSTTGTSTSTAAPINIVVKVESSNNVVWTGSKVPENGKNAVVKNLLTYCWNSSWDSVYTVDHVWSSEQQRTVSTGDTVNAGDTVSFLLKEKNSSTSSTATTTNKFPYNVYLNIYTDTLVGSPDKCINITNGIALDGLVTLSEVKTVVTNYYYADDSYGITYDGLYLAQGNWVANYVADTKKYDEIYASEMQQTGYVYINVMIGNATAYSTATADSSNPKTGDDIYMAVAALGLSGAALASALYVFTRKRVAK